MAGWRRRRASVMSVFSKAFEVTRTRAMRISPIGLRVAWQTRGKLLTQRFADLIHTLTIAVVKIHADPTSTIP